MPRLIDKFDFYRSWNGYVSISQTSTATATRDLRGLVQLGALIKTGKLKGTRYWLNLGSASSVKRV